LWSCRRRRLGGCRRHRRGSAPRKCSTSSTRRFFARPSSVLFDPAGAANETPTDEDAGPAARSGPSHARHDAARLARRRMGADLRAPAHGGRLHCADAEHDRAPVPRSAECLQGRPQGPRVRHRRGHDLRRTFITLAQVDGARRDLLETITHGPRGNIINVYTTFPWPALCAEVAKLRIDKLPAGVTKTGVAKPISRGAGSRRRLAIACYGLATAQRNWRNRWRKGATPAGFETEVNPNRFADLQNRNNGLRVLLGAGEISWKPHKAVRLGPNWAQSRWAY
jgi:hypothetical protein